MKEVIRQGAFETNSSSEHTIAVVESSLFEKWKAGELVARVERLNECKKCNGNFDSWQMDICFQHADTDWKVYNEKLLEKLISERKERINRQKESNLRAIKDPEMMELYHFTPEKIEAAYKEHMAELEKDEVYLFEHVFSKVYGGFWVTWEEFRQEFFKEDCISPFFHEVDLKMGRPKLTVLGKYNHT